MTTTDLAPWEIRNAVLSARAASMIETANDDTLPLRPFGRVIIRKVAYRLQELAQMLVRRGTTARPDETSTRLDVVGTTGGKATVETAVPRPEGEIS